MSSIKSIQNLSKSVVELYKKGTPPHIVKKYISEKTGWKKTKSSEIYKDIIVKCVGPEISSQESWEENIETLEKPYFNKETRQYIVFLKSIGRNIVVNEDKHKSILQMYSAWDGEDKSITEICRNVQWPRPVLTEYLKKFAITHDSLPFTDEDVDSNQDEELVGRLKELRKFSIHQKFEKDSWNETRDNAKKWVEFKYKQLDPFTNFLSKWVPPEYKSVKFTGEHKKLNKHWISSLSDLHFGAKGEERFNYFNGGWNHKDIENNIKSYAVKIKEEVNSRKYGFDEATLVCLGDFAHSNFGFTDKGTKLDYEFTGEDQFDFAFSTLVIFINELLTIFPKLTVRSVQGNHSSFNDYVIAKVLEAYYRKEPRITFDTTTKRYLTFKIHNSLFLMEHGYSPWYKAKLPSSPVKRESYINNLFLSKPELLQGVRSKYFLSADQHHAELSERNSYESIMFSCINRGDRYSDNSGFNSRPRQNCLVVDEDGLKEIIHFYFD